VKQSKSPKISFREDIILKGGYLINLKNGEFFYCNEKAQEIATFILESKSADEVLITNRFGKEANKFLDQLRQWGLLKNSEKLKHLHSKIERLSGKFPFYLQWHITERCNLKCKHCYLKKYTEEGELETLKEDFLKIEQLAKSLGRKLIVAITGGEPLLHPSLFELVEYLNAKNTVKEIRIATNGTLLTDRIARRLAKLHIKKIQISLDGIEKTHDEIRGVGSFKKATNGIKIACKYRLQTLVQMVVNKRNIDEVDSVLEILKTLGVDEVRFSLFIPIGTGKSLKNLALSSNDTKKLFYRLEKLSKKYKKPKILKGRPLWCLVNKKESGVCDFDSGTCLMPNGDLYPCIRLPITIGNIRKQGIFEIWYNTEFMWLHRNFQNLKGKCHNCKFVKICRGCRAMAFAYYGDHLMEDPTCWLNNF